MRLNRFFNPAAYKRWAYRQLKDLRLYGIRRLRPTQIGVQFEYANAVRSPDSSSLHLRSLKSRPGEVLKIEQIPDINEEFDDVARICHSRYGVFPISFSYPFQSTADPSSERSHLVAPILPGEQYRYQDENAYLDKYRSSYYGITHKKGGWDCFRHLEIMYSGSVPLMHDASQIPEFDMVHYPRRTLIDIYRTFRATPRAPSERVRSSLREYFNRNLTSRSMASYLLRMARLSDAKRILFVDENLYDGVDYLSLLTLIGLYQVPEVEVTAMVQVPYIWDDWRGNSQVLYGRGFGYTRVLAQEKRLNEGVISVARAKRDLRTGRYDVVVFGSIMRNLRLHAHLRDVVSPEQIVLINGEDLPVTRQTLDVLASTGSPTFIRSIG